MQEPNTPIPATQLVMTRLHLEDLPQVTPEPGYELRYYQPGDEDAWSRLMSECFGLPFDFTTALASSPFFTPERVWFIECAGEMVASACAWRYPLWGLQTGLIHQVAASPRHKGHRLGYLVSLASLHQFVREGIHHAVLQTDDHRLPAIATYLKLGFRPYLAGDGHAERWQQIFKALK